MARYLLDENMPRSLAALLRADGLDVQDVRDVGLRGDSDLKVLAYATQHAMALITRDRELGNITAYPLGSHAGIVLIRYTENLTTAELQALVLPALRLLSADDLHGNVAVLDSKGLRIRRKS